MSATGVSVVVCCYNSADRLPQTIRHLAIQRVSPHVNWEVIVVDNASTDDTGKVAKQEWAKHGCSASFAVLYEEKAGLSNARNCGIQAAAFDLLIFCDDDNWLNQDYIETGYSIMDKHPQVGALGGETAPVAEIALPGWFRGAKSNYAIGSQAERSGDVTSRLYLWGCGLVVRKEPYLQAFAKFPSVLTGRKAHQLTSGEDSELCMRLIMMGYRLYYSEQLKLQHYIPVSRLNEEYSDRLMDGFVSAHQILRIYAKLIVLRSSNPASEKPGFFKQIAKILLKRSGMIKRWNIDEDVLNLFLSTGLRLGPIPGDIIAIKQFSNRHPNKILID
ncbi:MAG TPA: glycosyltransferase [Mucilaginibacter sp.]